MMGSLKRKIDNVRDANRPPAKRQAIPTCRDADPPFQEAMSLRQRAEPYELATVKMPLCALSTVWKQGKSRAIRPKHVTRLLNLFVHGGEGKAAGVVREAAENYLLVQCSKEAVQRMKDHLGSGMDEVASFLDWGVINEEVKAEVMNGLHRIATLIEYVKVTKSDAALLWWTCIIYDQGAYE